MANSECLQGHDIPSSQSPCISEVASLHQTLVFPFTDLGTEQIFTLQCLHNPQTAFVWVVHQGLPCLALLLFDAFAHSAPFDHLPSQTSTKNVF